MICGKEIEPWTMATNANKLSTIFMIAFHCCWWRNKLSAFTLAFIKRFIKTVPVYVHMFTSYVYNEFVFLRPPLVQWAFSSWKWLHYSNWLWEGKNITYKCNGGYWLRGPPVRVCNATTGNWTMEAPICEGRFDSGKSWITLLVDYAAQLF